MQQLQAKTGDRHLILAMALMATLFFPVIISCLLYLFNISIAPYTLPMATLLFGLFFGVLGYRQQQLKSTLITAFIAFLITAAFATVCSWFISYSYDCWIYHTKAVILLSEGWNPVYAHDDTISKWVSHYPKFAWIFAATLYAFSGKLFAGTCIVFIQILSTFLIASSVLAKKNPTRPRFRKVIAFLIALNPVIASQLFSYYNDGLLGNAIISICLLLYAIDRGYYSLSNSTVTLLLMANAAMLANLKYTGLVHLALIGILYLTWLLWNKTLSPKSATKLFLIILTPVMLIGTTSYIPNIIHHQNPFYYVVGKDKIDFTAGQTPKMYDNHNRCTDMLMSLTSPSTRQLKDSYTYKLPFVMTVDECRNLSSTDLRIGGFGPLFQLFLWMFFLLGAINLIAHYRCKKEQTSPLFSKNKQEFALIIILLLQLSFIPYLWWTRYIPFLAAIPLLCISFISAGNKTSSRTMSFVTVITLAVALLNTGLLSGVKSISSYTYSSKCNTAIQRLKQATSPARVQYCYSYLFRQDTAEEILRNEGVVVETLPPTSRESFQGKSITSFGFIILPEKHHNE